MKSKNVSMRVFFVFVIFELLSACSRPQQPSDTKAEPVRQQQPVLNSNSDTVLKYKEIEADAIINNSKWKPLTGNVNVSVTQDHKKYYAIMLTDGVNNVILTYNGKETTGKVNTGDFFSASVLDATGIPYICSDGYIQFTRFDTIARRMSARFRLKCYKGGTSPMDISSASFNDLSW
ncbi:MAG TPA: hypothetical protein PKN14_03205 [Bacteroidia bacterium]|nr:hypothetical protein [Bacteroidia bacterium]HNR48232.1 hypothetical protein [Bacteroidia bacterium]HNT81227.1 hypothetical protein [Bacteroidia bacterium]